jgi:hypothetical protein
MCTEDPRFFTGPFFRTAMEKGPKFRPQNGVDFLESRAIGDDNSAADDSADDEDEPPNLATWKNFTRERLTGWGKLISEEFGTDEEDVIREIEHASRAIQAIRDSIPKEAEEPTMTITAADQSDKALLHPGPHGRAKFIFATADKAPIFVTVCGTGYALKMWSYYNSDKQERILLSLLQPILDRHRKYTEDHGVTVYDVDEADEGAGNTPPPHCRNNNQIRKRVARAYILWKLHNKPKTGIRVIAGGTQISTTAVSQTLSRALKLIIGECNGTSQKCFFASVTCAPAQLSNPQMKSLDTFVISIDFVAVATSRSIRERSSLLTSLSCTHFYLRMLLLLTLVQL